MRYRHLFQEVSCDLCGDGEVRVVYPSTLSEADLAHTVEQHTYSGWTNSAGRIVECVRCRLRFVSPREKPSAIWQTYRQIVDPLYLHDLDSRRRSFARGLHQIARLRRRPGRLLDVGCSVGVFLELCREAGWEVEGVELSEWSAAQARRRGLSVHNAPFEELDLPRGAYDAVCFWDVLEHVPVPSDPLRKAHGLLRPGGLLVVSTPNIHSVSARLLGRRWWFVERDHITYYSRTTLGRQLRQVGFEPKSWHLVFRTYPLSYLCHKLESYLPGVSSLAGRFLRALGLGSLRLAIPAGQVTVLAVKREAEQRPRTPTG